ncbi:cytochrome P450 94A1-like [Telopea speciosissima]|uniref:cytochrome P450 94A1-like n=1 Tax=Telopea speciosissima TaxID=54955 RepID=UPI001CC3B625|nr:cytochrome P450 94A1-like [Telopea speciosissima]
MSQQLEFIVSPLLFIIPFVFFFYFLIRKNKISSGSSSPANISRKVPTAYPLIGHIFAAPKNRDLMMPWIAEVLQNSPNATFTFKRFSRRNIITANPAIVQHILKTQFYKYPKGPFFRNNLHDLLGSGIFNADGDRWKFERQISSPEFNTKSLRKFVGTVVEAELSECLLPLLCTANTENSVLDLQDILQRFAFDNICKIAFGFDPKSLSPSFPQPQAEFAVAFDEAVKLITGRFPTMFPAVWKMKRALNIRSEKQLGLAVSHIRQFARSIVREKRRELEEKSSLETVDLLSRILNSGQLDEDLATDMVISFILAGRDTTSAALTWFFWLVSCNYQVEEEIVKEIKEMKDTMDYDGVKDMVYTHASLCESMRLYPPVPHDAKEAAEDDVLPDGTIVKKGMRVTYHPYTMGRLESLWGKDWAEFRPERWLEREESSGKWRFVARDPYTYTVFQAGPRICLGKEMAFLQMQRIVAGVMRRYRVGPAEKGFEPVFVSYLTSKMKGGFPVRIERRE